jgi:hypothetical protein
MNTTTPVCRLGPGEYRADATEGITLPEQLPPTQVLSLNRIFRRLPCPRCGQSAPHLRSLRRTLHDLGDPLTGRPRDLLLDYSQHRCRRCNLYFHADTSDLADPYAHYTHRVVHTALALVAEDNLPYRQASWHLWRDHRVFVPFATIQNWVEAAGEKGAATGPGTLSGPGAAQFQRLCRRR